MEDPWFVTGDCLTPLKVWCPRTGRHVVWPVDCYGAHRDKEPERLCLDLFDEPQSCRFGLLRDLHDLYVTANFCDITWAMISQAAQGAGDVELYETVNAPENQISTQTSSSRRG